MILQIVLILAGFLLLLKGAEWAVEAASMLAKKFNVSDLVIGLTIVSFGTSAPELVVNAIGTWEGHHDIVFGNILGSNNFNIFVTLGIIGMVAPLRVQQSTVWKEIPFLLVACGVGILFLNDYWGGQVHVLETWEASIMLAFFVGFMFYVFRMLKNAIPELQVKAIAKPMWQIIAMIILGLAGLIGGGRIVVVNAVSLAESFGVSEKVIGLTIVAAGTSLPELVTALLAVLKNKTDLAIGSVVGSNIFNMLLILPLSAFINELSYNPSMNSDLWMSTAGTFFLFLSLYVTKKHTLYCWQAALLFFSFVAYSLYCFINY
ncbi:MAG: cation:H+ antiporter [Arcticibacterium sp.]|jgi:cation:H+ antiporter